MNYATESDIETIYSSHVLDRVAFDPETGGRDSERVARALESATHEIDMYLSVFHTMPLATIPPMVRQMAVDIAIYRMALTQDKLTIEIENRYKATITTLTSISQGKLALGIPAGSGQGPIGGGGEDGVSSPLQYIATLDSVLK